MKFQLMLAAVAFTIFSCKKNNPESLFTTDKETYKLKESVQFNNQSTDGLTYFWDFGDGESSILKSPGHTYDESGEYIVTLRVEGAKKTMPSEFNKKLLITDPENGFNVPDVLFANSSWVGDSITNIYYNCSNGIIDYSNGTYNSTMAFYDDNTVLMMGPSIANLCEYEVLSDSVIGFYESNYYRIWTFSKTDDRLTLTKRQVSTCTDFPNLLQGNLTIQHFVKQ